MARLAACTIIMLVMVFGLATCSDDDKPTIPNSQPQKYEGITLTDENGNILGGDTTDWCFSAVAGKGGVPAEFALYPAYPNPGTAPIEIVFDLPAAAAVKLFIIDSTGATRCTLVDSTMGAGHYHIAWDTKDEGDHYLLPGIYRYRINAGDFECYGDIQIAETPHRIILYSRLADDTMSVDYDANTTVAGLSLVFLYQGTVGEPIYGSATSEMDITSTAVNDSLRILFLTSMQELTFMPPGIHHLCSIPIAGSMILSYADASDTGAVIPSFIVNTP